MHDCKWLLICFVSALMDCVDSANLSINLLPLCVTTFNQSVIDRRQIKIRCAVGLPAGMDHKAPRGKYFNTFAPKYEMSDRR